MSTNKTSINTTVTIATLTGIIPVIALIFLQHNPYIPRHTIEIYLAFILVYITGVHWGFAYEENSLSHLCFSLLASLTPMLIIYLQQLEKWTTSTTCLSLLGILASILTLEHILPVSKQKKPFLRHRIYASFFLAMAVVGYIIFT